MEPQEVHQQMHHFCERQAQAERHTAEEGCRLAPHTTQEADQDGAIEVEQPGMIGTRWVAEATCIKTAASTTARVEVIAVAITQVPTAVPRSTEGMPCGNTPGQVCRETPPQYDGKQTKAWKPGYSL